MSVRGGIGGIRFQWEELEEGARALGLLAEDMQRINQSLYRIELELQPVIFPAGLDWQAVAFSATGIGARDALARARQSVQTGLGGIEDTANKVKFNLFTYRTMDAMANHHMAQAMAGTNALGQFAAMGAQSMDRYQPAPVSIAALNPAGVDVEFGGGIHGLLDRVRYAREQGTGIFEVLEVESAQGKAFVVSIPGTQGREFYATANPFDVMGNADAVRHDSRYFAQAVDEALKQAGAGAGDKLYLVGYSQGGLHAMNVAENEEINTAYSVQLVVTAGSPTAWESSGPASYLHLEHRDDHVPRVDAGTNPDEAGRTTITLNSDVESVSGAESGLNSAHKLDVYLAGAAQADRSSHPSVAAVTGALAGAVGAGSVARSHVFKATRVLSPSPQSTQKPGGGQTPGRRRPSR